MSHRNQVQMNISNSKKSKKYETCAHSFVIHFYENGLNQVRDLEHFQMSITNSKKKPAHIVFLCHIVTRKNINLVYIYLHENAFTQM